MGRNQASTISYNADGVDQLTGGRRHVEDGARSSFNRGEQDIVAIVIGQENHLRVGAGLGLSHGCVGSHAIVQAKVEDHYVRSQFLGIRSRVRAQPKLPTTTIPGSLLKRASNASATSCCLSTIKSGSDQPPGGSSSAAGRRIRRLKTTGTR